MKRILSEHTALLPVRNTQGNCSSADNRALKVNISLIRIIQTLLKRTGGIDNILGIIENNTKGSFSKCQDIRPEIKTPI
jgi:hypothetical protein